MTSPYPEALRPKIYRNIEGLDAKFPVIEFAVRMTVDVTGSCSARSTDADKSDVYATSARVHVPDHPCCHSPSADPDAQPSKNGMRSNSEHTSDSVKQATLQGGGTSHSDTGEELQTSSDGLPRPEVLTADILRALAQSNSTDVVTDTPSVYSRDSNQCSSDGKASTRSTDTMELLRRRNIPKVGNRVWRNTLSDASSLHLIGQARPGWLSDLDFASTEIARHLDQVENKVAAGKGQVKLEAGNTESNLLGLHSDRCDKETSKTPEYKASRSRPGTPYADMGSEHSTPRRFIAAASETEARELGLQFPLRIGNLYAGF